MLSILRQSRVGGTVSGRLDPAPGGLVRRPYASLLKFRHKKTDIYNDLDIHHIPFAPEESERRVLLPTRTRKIPYLHQE